MLLTSFVSFSRSYFSFSSLVWPLDVFAVPLRCCCCPAATEAGLLCVEPLAEWMAGLKSSAGANVIEFS
jgi:hypothetical protein